MLKNGELMQHLSRGAKSLPSRGLKAEAANSESPNPTVGTRRRRIPRHASATASWVFGAVFVTFLVVFTIMVPHPTPPQMTMVQFFMALTAGFLAFFLLGGVVLKGTVFGLTISATGGIALFVLMQFTPSPFLKPGPEFPVLPATQAGGGLAAASVDTPAAPCTGDTNARSTFGAGSEEASIVFENPRPDDVLLFWLDYEGVKQPFGAVPPRGSVSIRSWTTHPWMVTDRGGQCIAIYTTKAKVARFTIT